MLNLKKKSQQLDFIFGNAKKQTFPFIFLPLCLALKLVCRINYTSERISVFYSFTFVPNHKIMFIPWIKVSDGFQRLWAPEQFVQYGDSVSEARPFGAVVLPTLEHELVDSGGAVHRSRKPECLVDSLHDLRKSKTSA